MGRPLISRLLAAALFSSAISSVSAAAPAVVVSCAGRAVTGARAPDGHLLGDVLLDQAMKGKRFALAPGQALVTMEGTLVQYYSLRQSLRAIPEDEGKLAVQRIASLIESNFVIAAQMALGVSAMQGHIPPGLLGPVDRYVSNITEPYHDDAELTSIKRKVDAGRRAVEAVSAAARPFARWAVLAFAWDDKVAIDAALGGFCMSSPTRTDTQTLAKAVTAARLDRSQVFPDSAALSGGVPVDGREHRH